MYKEGIYSTVTHNDKVFMVDDLIQLCKCKEPVFVNINQVSWILPFTTVFNERLNVDTKYPLIVLEENAKLFLLDGAHRLTVLKNNGVTVIQVYIIKENEI